MKVLCLASEVRLFDERVPHFLDDAYRVDHGVALDESAHLTSQTAHDVNILRHGELHAGALDFHGNRFARDQLGLMNLSQGCAAQRLWIYRFENLTVFLAVNGTKSDQDLLERQRIALRLKFGKLLAICLGQDLGPGRQRLANFHEAGAKLLERGAKLLRGELIQELVLMQNGSDLAHAL